MKLLNIDANAKTVKGQKKGYRTAILYLAPYNLSGYQVCPMASKGCAAACLNTAGRGAFTATQQARIRKTLAFFEERESFMLQLERELAAHVRSSRKAGFIPVVRLNGTSDIPWENIPFTGADGKRYPNMMARFPKVKFYDYTKRHNRKNLPKNYSLTYSLAEDNDARAIKAIKNGTNVAVVFRKKLPRKFLGLPVVDGDETDLRFLDKRTRIIGLKAKGKARKDTSGFVRECEA